MVAPFAQGTGHVVFSIWLDPNIEVGSNLARFADRTLFGAIGLPALKNLDKMTDDDVAPMNCDRRCCPVRIPIMGEPVHQLPSVFRGALQILTQLLVTISAAQLVRHNCNPGHKVSVLGPLNC